MIKIHEESIQNPLEVYEYIFPRMDLIQRSSQMKSAVLRCQTPKRLCCFHLAFQPPHPPLLLGSPPLTPAVQLAGRDNTLEPNNYIKVMEKRNVVRISVVSPAASCREQTEETKIKK